MFRYKSIIDLVNIFGDAVFSFSGSTGVTGLALDEFHTYRFESTDGVNFTVAVDGQVFIDKSDNQNPDGGSFVNMGAGGGCLPTFHTVNEWDFVRYGTVATDEQIIASDPPAGLVGLAALAGLDRFTVTFDATNYVYIDDITVTVTGGIAPTVIQTRRVENTEPNLVEIVLDRHPPFDETTTFTFDTGLAVNCDPGVGAIVNCVQYTLPPAECGDGVVNQPTEECDGQDKAACPGGCRADCTCQVCGDGIVEGGEECDDTGESATCDDDCTLAVCGDGIINVTAGELCDNGPANSDLVPDACRTTCLPAGCGDDVEDTGEECDDGESNSDTSADACRLNCRLATCGDSALDTGEECDEGGNTATCDADCTVAECGDGRLNAVAGEQCDNGTSNSDTVADACRTDCQRSSCGDDLMDTSEECDGLDDALCPGLCRATCACITCGDGIIDSGEQCDDGASNSDIQPDACRTDCTLPNCGDDVKDSNESCDGLDDSACPTECRDNCVCPTCGDGILDPNEQCDNGPTNSDTEPDACRTTCTQPTCGDNVTDANEVCDGTSDEACPGDCLQDCTCDIPEIPTLSNWGLLALAVLLLALSRRYFGRLST